MRPLLNLSFCFFFAFGLSACGGGGGGGGSTTQNPVGSGSSGSSPSVSSGSSSSTTTYSYDRIGDEFTNKVWDSVTIGRFRDKDQTYITDYSDDVETVFTESASSVDIDITGTKLFDETPIEHSWLVTESNASLTELYDPTNPSSVMAGVISQSFANVDIGFLTYSPDYLAGEGIQYTDLAFVEITWKDGSRKDSFVTAYGDATESGDLPSSGTKQYNIDSYLMMEYWTNNGATSDRVLAGGEGQLSINFTNDTVTGSIELSEYYDWDLWMLGGSDISQIFGIDRVTLDIVNGTLSGGNFVASVEINHDSSDGTSFVGSGTLQGTLFGPDGDEVAVSFYMLEDTNNDTQDVYWWDLFGGAIGQ